jgi:AraC family transcriptional regulator, regulatory protein of adaptative response / methylated-DNA-[protein]-cysteine methyltransferase
MAGSRPLAMTQTDTLWQAVAERRRAADGAFVYAVRTTGIYCRPSCPARRPARERVEFFALPEAAERAGYRACRRCRPQDHAAADPALARVRAACRAIDTALEAEAPLPSLDELGAQLGASPFHLQRSFKKHLGISPRGYAEARRLARVKTMLRQGNGVADAVYGAGYGSASRLYERADGQLGMTPATYAKGGAGARIVFATAACALGRVLVAATGRGLCAVSLGDDDAALEAGLRAEFPGAEIAAGTPGPLLEEVLAIVAGAAPDRELPLDLRATGFQWRVWEALRAIPPGETRSYAGLARALGMPGAARAVGRACGANKLAIVIPCHRVRREDGALGGYRWGVGRKERLLEAERRARGDG